MRAPLRLGGNGLVTPSPLPMQQLHQNSGNTNPNWRASLFDNIREEGLNLEIEKNVENNETFVECVKITMEDIQPEIEYWNSAIVCYILGCKPPFRIVNGFIRRIWGKYGIKKIAMLENGVFMVRFRMVEGKMKAIEGVLILYDGKPVIVKNWTLDLDLSSESVKVVPTWIRMPGLPLKYWGQSVLNKITGIIGKLIRTDRATAQKDMLEYAIVLVEVKLDQGFPEKVAFMNEKGDMQEQKVEYECKPIFCSDCRGIWHNMEQCRKKKQEIAQRNVKTRQVWRRKDTVEVQNKNAPEPGNNMNIMANIAASIPEMQNGNISRDEDVVEEGNIRQMIETQKDNKEQDKQIDGIQKICVIQGESVVESLPHG